MQNLVAHQRVELDEGFVTVPLDSGEEASVRLSLVVRKEADPADGSFCRLRQLVDANVYLGCFTDRSGYILKWLELWVRNYDNIADKLHENAFDVINNTVLDERWDRQKKILELSKASHVYKTSLDTQMEYSLHVDTYNKKVGFVKDAESKTHWKICKEDDLLKRLELPPYSTSIHRYLYLESLGADSYFLPITPNAPQNAKTKSLEEGIGTRSTLLPFNSYGGSIMVREVAPMTVESYLCVLTGRAWDGVGQGKKKLMPSGVYREISDEVSVGYAAGRLVSTRQGQRAWKLESLFLKVKLFYEMISQVKACVELDQKPFFSLELSSFGINLPNTAPTSPFLWDAAVVMNQTSDAIAFSVEKQSDLDSRETTYFRTYRPLGASIYRPESLAQHRTLMAEVTLLKIDRDRDTGLYEITGSMRSSDIQSHGVLGRHFYFIDYSVRGKRTRLVAEMTEVDARVADKIQFKTLKLPLTSEQQLALESFIGVEQVGVYCEIFPVLGTPCDLYSLGVIGLEVLFYGSDIALAQLKDQLRTLASACIDLSDELNIAERIVQTFEAEPHLRETLMPDSLGLAHSGKDHMGLPPEERIWRDLGRYMAILRSLNLGDTQSTQLVGEVLDEMIREIGGSI